MLKLNSPKFGRAIRFKETASMSANEMVSHFVKIKNFYRTQLTKLVGGHADALRYYCANDCAYIFDAGFLKAIVRTIEEKGSGKGCMVLFQGLRTEGETAGPHGRPTIIATAYAAKEDAGGKFFLEHLPIAKDAMPVLLDDDYDGIEHPGDGSSPNSKIFMSAAGSQANEEDADDWRPVVLDPSDGETDYVIKKIITEDELKAWL